MLIEMALVLPISIAVLISCVEPTDDPSRSAPGRRSWFGANDPSTLLARRSTLSLGQHVAMSNVTAPC
jgi:hypothetical protein